MSDFEKTLIDFPRMISGRVIMDVAIREGEIIDEFEILERIGGGAFSRVHIARHIPTGTYVAAKIVDLGHLKQHEFVGIMREISVYMQVDHPNVCTCYRLSVVEKNLIFFIEFAKGGTLLQYVNKRCRLMEVEAQRLFVQMFETLRHLHIYYFLVHRDLKLENILLDEHNNVKITDFGLSSTYYCNIMRSSVGTPGYTPPEVVAGSEYDEKCDVWSLGICLYAMMTGNLPFMSTNNYRKLIEEADNFKFPSEFSPALTDLLRRMLQTRPASRPRLTDIQNHPWLKGIKPAGSNISPMPMVFYRVDSINDILKFKRRPGKIDEVALERCAEYGLDIEKVRRDLDEGMVNSNTATYFAILHPMLEKPAKEIPAPPHSVRVNGARKRSIGITIPKSQSRPTVAKDVYKKAALDVISNNPSAALKRRQSPFVGVH